MRVTFQEGRRRLATGVGAVVVGLVALAFAKIADWAQAMSQHLFARAPLAPLALTPAIFVAVSYLTIRWLPQARGSGIPQVIAAAREPGQQAAERLADLRTGLGKLLLTVAMLFGGASVGREGPTVQVSAAVMVAVHRVLRVPISAGVLIAGGAAGVAAAFNTPLAGVAFAIEELAAAYEQRVALLVMGAVMISGLTMIAVSGDYLYFGTFNQSLSFGHTLLLAPVVGLCGGVSGGLFSRIVLAFTRDRTGWMAVFKRHPVVLSAVFGFIVALVGVASGGTTWGTGYAPARQLIEGGHLSLWFGFEKFVASLLTTMSGAPGGIFAPSLSVGAGVGNALAPLFSGVPASAVVLLGMAAYFVGVVRAPLTAAIILMETTAGRGMILPLFATALIADGASALVNREKLYVALSRGFLQPADHSLPSGEPRAPAEATGSITPH